MSLTRPAGRAYTTALGLLLVAGLLIPLWIGPYPPLFDYPNHLLQAQVVARSDDPAYDYAAGYVVKDSWALDSNALTTIVLVGLGQLMPVPLAGRLLLSLYVALFVGGVWLVLRPSDAAATLLPLAAPLAYAASFTSGWLNFSLAAAFSLYALALARRWCAVGGWPSLAGLAGLSLLIGSAHLFVWALMLLAVLAMAWALAPARPTGLLVLALGAPLVPLLPARPRLVALGLIGLLVAWAGSRLIARWQPSRPQMIGLATATIVAASLLIGPLAWLRTRLLPGLPMRADYKFGYLVNTFILPHQFVPADPWLSLGNGAILLGLAAAIAALVVALVRANAALRLFAPAGALALLYLIVPSGSSSIQITEPRVLLFALLAALPALRLPAAGPARASVAALVGLLAAIHLASALQLGQSYAARAELWSQQLSYLSPARSVLVLQENPASPAGPPVIGPLRSNIHYATTYTLERGGFNSRTFYNGPVRHRSELPIPSYWPQRGEGANQQLVAAHCAELRQAYDGVVVWGLPPPGLAVALDNCFHPVGAWEELAIWR